MAVVFQWTPLAKLSGNVMPSTQLAITFIVFCARESCPPSLGQVTSSTEAFITQADLLIYLQCKLLVQQQKFSQVVVREIP